MKIKNYDTPTACKKNYYFSEKKKAIAFLLDCLNIRKLSQSKPQLSLHNHVVLHTKKPRMEINKGFKIDNPNIMIKTVINNEEAISLLSECKKIERFQKES